MELDLQNAENPGSTGTLNLILWPDVPEMPIKDQRLCLVMRYGRKGFQNAVAFVAVTFKTLMELMRKSEPVVR